MFHRIAAFYRQLFSRKGFRRGLRIFLGVFFAYCIYNLIIFFAAMINSGAPFGEALRLYFNIPLFYAARIPTSASIALGIAIGLVWYFNRKGKNMEKKEPDEKAEGSPDAFREEEITETTRYKYR